MNFNVQLIKKSVNFFKIMLEDDKQAFLSNVLNKTFHQDKTSDFSGKNLFQSNLTLLLHKQID